MNIKDEEFYNESKQMVQCILAKYKLTYDTIEELTQETFMLFYKAKDRIVLQDKGHSYLSSIAHNRAKAEIKKLKALKRQGKLVFHIPDLIEDESPNTQRQLENRELNKKKWELYNALPEDTRKIFEYAFFQNMKYSKISEILNISETSIKSKIKRAREKLRGQLDKNTDYL